MCFVPTPDIVLPRQNTSTLSSFCAQMTGIGPNGVFCQNVVPQTACQFQCRMSMSWADQNPGNRNGSKFPAETWSAITDRRFLIWEDLTVRIPRQGGNMLADVQLGYFGCSCECRVYITPKRETETRKGSGQATDPEARR